MWMQTTIPSHYHPINQHQNKETSVYIVWGGRMSHVSITWEWVCGMKTLKCGVLVVSDREHNHKTWLSEGIGGICILFPEFLSSLQLAIIVCFMQYSRPLTNRNEGNDNPPTLALWSLMNTTALKEADIENKEIDLAKNKSRNAYKKQR